MNSATSKILTVITPPRRLLHINLKELWEYRELAYDSAA